jgi:hypothetical protein
LRVERTFVDGEYACADIILVEADGSTLVRANLKWAQWGQAPLRPFVTFLVENLVVWIKMLTFVPLIQI